MRTYSWKAKWTSVAVTLPNIRWSWDLGLPLIVWQSTTRQPVGTQQTLSIGHTPTLSVNFGQHNRDGLKRKKELRFCCDLRSLNAMTIKDAHLLPIIKNASHAWGRSTFTLALIWPGHFGKNNYARQIGKRRHYSGVTGNENADFTRCAARKAMDMH